MMTTTVTRVPERTDVDPSDCWDLEQLYATEEAWEQGFQALTEQVPTLKGYAGRLGESAATLREVLDGITEAGRLRDKVATYAYRKSDEDTRNAHFMGLKERVASLGTQLVEAMSWFRPELLQMETDTIDAYLQDDALAPYRFYLERILRYRDHTLSLGEERLLAMSREIARTAETAFGQLNNADLDFGTITLPTGEEVEVSHGGYLSYLQKPEREVRRAYFEKYYAGFEGHKNTLAATLHGAIKRDVFYAQARNYPSARTAALFSDRIPESVYDNLITCVHEHLPHLHRYNRLRKRLMGLDGLHMYDTYLPLVQEDDVNIPYGEAVDHIIEALQPLGERYCQVLQGGLLKGWVDRYENKGKRSGAYSSGCYDSMPYILMNYKADTYDSMYTLAHEAGHSMHTWLSTDQQPPQYADYPIFLAEVASTFNEELLTDHLLAGTSDERARAAIVNRSVDDFRGTIFRQAMFAEFEHRIHAMVEDGQPLTVDSLRKEYRKLLNLYHGPDFVVDDVLELECLRIPHFYYNFYVYKYATGMSAAIALSQKVQSGGSADVEAYLGFLQAGSTAYPLEILQRAGVDMSQPEPINLALGRFGELVTELEQLLG